MQVRIKFSADLVITGCDMREVRCKFEEMELFSQAARDCDVEYSETLLIEDAEDYKDLWKEYHNA